MQGERKIKQVLDFRSVCTNFAPENEVDRFEQLATTVKNAKIHGVRCMHSLGYPTFHLIEN